MRQPRTARSPGRHAHPPIRRFARAVVFFRFPIVAGWIAAVVGASVYLPSLEAEREHCVRALVPPESEALRAEIESIDRFGYPLLARTVVVQRDPEGVAPDAQARAVEQAASLTRGEYPHRRRAGARCDGRLGERLARPLQSAWRRQPHCGTASAAAAA